MMNSDEWRRWRWNLEPGDVLAEAAELVVLGKYLVLGGVAGAREVERRARRAEGGTATAAQLGEAVELAVLGEEHLQHGAHGKAVVLDGVRRHLRRQLARQPKCQPRWALLEF
ncbi:hypothetical protein E2562_006490 [Oryza meyeriana var. granulata]|uniref:Uncharacterized protein n=1 Tax=Oryza meyeriana var. granulata TaxID=110450 RepID=A0A6G1CN30_9ORYZ|nr:hypothetical protein E2562_006490 [Oryza meyeriana var. granulata]